MKVFGFPLNKLTNSKFFVKFYSLCYLLIKPKSNYKGQLIEIEKLSMKSRWKPSKTYLNEDCNDEEILSIVRDINSYDGSLEYLAWEDIDSFDELCDGMKPWEIARACFFGDFNPTHNYWKYDVYGNFESTDYLDFDECDVDVIEAIDNIPYSYLPLKFNEKIGEICTRNNRYICYFFIADFMGKVFVFISIPWLYISPTSPVSSL